MVKKWVIRYNAFTFSIRNVSTWTQLSPSDYLFCFKKASRSAISCWLICFSRPEGMADRLSARRERISSRLTVFSAWPEVLTVMVVGVSGATEVIRRLVYLFGKDDRLRPSVQVVNNFFLTGWSFDIPAVCCP